MYFEETKKVNELFKIALVVILIAGVIAGIVCGMALRVPTEDASEALTKLTTSSYIEYTEKQELLEKAQETEWTGTGIGVMLGTWVMSAITALLLYAKSHQIIMLDMIASSVAGKREDELAEEEATDAEQETAAE